MTGAALAAGLRAASTKLCRLEAREDCIKVLLLTRDYAGVEALRALTDEEYASIVAQHVGRPAPAPTPRGYVIDLDGPPARRGAAD